MGVVAVPTGRGRRCWGGPRLAPGLRPRRWRVRLFRVDPVGGAGVHPGPAIGIASFADEEAPPSAPPCAGSAPLTGQLDPDRARALRDTDAATLPEAMAEAGHDPAHLGADPETLRRIGTFVQLHVEQGRALVDRVAEVDEGLALLDAPLDERADPAQRLGVGAEVGRVAPGLGHRLGQGDAVGAAQRRDPVGVELAGQQPRARAGDAEAGPSSSASWRCPSAGPG